MSFGDINEKSANPINIALQFEKLPSSGRKKKDALLVELARGLRKNTVRALHSKIEGIKNNLANLKNDEFLHFFNRPCAELQIPTHM